MGKRPLKKLLCRCNHVLRVASWIVPRGQRVEWLREWQGEVWHWGHFLMESGRLGGRTEQELLRHCWGAFADATWHRFNRVAVLRFMREWPRTPRFCIFAILVVLVLLLPGDPVSIFSGFIAPPPYADSDHLMTVFVPGRPTWLAPELLRDWVFQLSRETPLISGSAAYAWRPSRVRGPAGTESILSARVTPGLFGLLGVRPSLGRTIQETDLSSCASCVVLSDALWRSQFHSDQRVIGRSLFLDGRQVEIIGVLPPHCRLAGREIGVFSPFGTGSRPLLPMYEWPGALLRVPTGADPVKARKELEAVIDQADSMAANTKLGIISVKDVEYEFLEFCLTWSIRDHLGRCRSCLKRFGAKVNLGNAGDLFLERTGTELVCDGGHGILHLPLMQDSCVDSERWTYFDESWSALFGKREEGFSRSHLIFLPPRSTWEEDDDD